MKMKKVNGNWYSRKEFLTYELRAIVVFRDQDDEKHRIDIYTTQTDKDLIWDDISESVTEKVKSFEVIHTATKEQDELSSKFIEEWLNEE